MISVCVATYNGEKFIREQIDSILCQLSSDDEIIVSDDGSTDGTIVIINCIGDKRIRIIEGPRKHSPTFNFENALKEAKGDYIFLADQDDVWKTNKVEVCMKWLQKYDCVVSDAEVTDSNLNPLYPSLYAIMQVRQGHIYNTVWKNGYTGCCMAFRRNILEASLPFPKDIPMHDIWIGNVAAYKYNVKFIPDKLILFRRHKETISCNGKGSKYSIWQQMKFRWTIIKNIVNLYIKFQ
ncbi:MAG: glycosyltransferase family 2 protein [Prevotella sp.]|nr:glycosyltransferase family 2 protein [Prevotella sp.]